MEWKEGRRRVLERGGGGDYSYNINYHDRWTENEVLLLLI